jgi:mono/diheme cytochrome c family protein
MALLVFVVAVYAGGWAIVTVRDLPEFAVAGKPLDLTFMVRQHGVSPMGGVKPTVTAKSGTDAVTASAVATKTTGEYMATLVLPHPGNWKLQIANGLHDSNLPDMTVMASGSPTPPPLSQVALGERLFVAKGCIGCHINRDVQTKNLVEIGPDLTGKRFPEAYLKSFLANPQAALGRKADPEREEMPNLGLTKSEIAALTAFINRERPR